MRALLIPLVFLAGCAQFPELDAARSPGVESAPYPALLPFETVLNAPEPRATSEALEGVTARADALLRRAQALGGPVVDDATRARMRRGVAPLPGSS